jgi:hypothetical protein
MGSLGCLGGWQCRAGRRGRGADDDTAVVAAVLGAASNRFEGKLVTTLQRIATEM